MSLFKSKSKAARPVGGQFRVVKVTTGDGRISYKVQRYQWGWEYMEWRTESRESSLEKALAYIRKERGKEVVTREVVWP